MANVSHPGRSQDISDMTEQEWLENQRKKIGGSDIPAIMGCGFISQYTLWSRKMGAKSNNEQSEPAFIGIELENTVAKHFSWKYDIPVEQDHKIRYHKDLDFLGVNLDRIILSNEKFGGIGINQIKTCNESKIKKWKNKGHDIPKPYLVQALTEMDVMDVDYGFVSVLVFDQWSRYFIHHYIDKAHYEDVIERIREEVTDFWSYVRDRVPPPMQAESELDDYYSDPVAGKSIKATMDLMNRMKQTGSRKKAKVLAKEYMGDAEILLSPDGKRLATWKRHTRESFDKESLEREHPKIYEQYLEDTPYRQFLWKV